MLHVIPWRYLPFMAWMIFEIVQAQSIPKTSFSCDGRTSGYYADVSTGCQVYHMCDGLGRQFSYECPSKTLFQQRMLICDHWYMVNCSKAEEDYSANLLIGQREKAFVEDLHYHRTPRPDLVDPGNSDYNTYRVDQRESHEETQSVKNFVESTTSSNNYYKREESDTATPTLVKQVFYRTNYNRINKGINSDIQPKGRGVDFNSVNRNGNTVNANSNLGFTKDNLSTANNFFKPRIQQDNIPAAQIDAQNQNKENTFSGQVNFPSRFKATTPVYPKHVDVDLSKFSEFGNPLEQNPGDDVIINFSSKFEATTPVYPKQVPTDPSRLSEFDIPFEQNPVETISVNFPSKFKATTPVYPTHVETDSSKLSEFDILPNEQETVEFVSVNFPSNFRATTPVYPQHVDVDLSKFFEFEEIPPGQNTGSEENVVVNFASNFKATTPVYPKQVDVDLSKFLEPVELPLEDVTGKNGSVNFASDFTATTPVYPQTVESTSVNPDEAGLLPPLPSSESEIDVNQAENKIHVNFASNFQATTPNYPASVEPTSPDPNEVGLVVPQLGADEQDPDIPSLDIQPPNFDQTFSRRSDEYDPTVVGNTFNSKQLTEFMITMKPEQLRNLKELWHIPDYDFPLESASRPSYSSDFSSFQAKSVNKR